VSCDSDLQISEKKRCSTASSNGSDDVHRYEAVLPKNQECKFCLLSVLEINLMMNEVMGEPFVKGI